MSAPPDRKPRKRGGKAGKRGLSGEQVPVLVAADRSGATPLAPCCPRSAPRPSARVLAPVPDRDVLLVTDGCTGYPPLAVRLGVGQGVPNQSEGERVRGDIHIDTVNDRHSRLKDFLRVRRGIATKYLANYLRWFHLIGLHPEPTPRYCLAAAIEG